MLPKGTWPSSLIGMFQLCIRAGMVALHYFHYKSEALPAILFTTCIDLFFWGALLTISSAACIDLYIFKGPLCHSVYQVFCFVYL